MSGDRAVRSKDGTPIAYDSAGDGPAVILVGGAFSFRRYKSWLQLVELLAPRFRVWNYDRRGRGDSGDAPQYAVERELEDLDALVKEAGGSAHIFGMSSGGVLALRAAAAGVPIERAVVYQPPFSVDESGHLAPPDFETRLRELVAERQEDGVHPAAAGDLGDLSLDPHRAQPVDPPGDRHRDLPDGGRVLGRGLKCHAWNPKADHLRWGS